MVLVLLFGTLCTTNFAIILMGRRELDSLFIVAVSVVVVEFVFNVPPTAKVIWRREKAVSVLWLFLMVPCV